MRKILSVVLSLSVLAAVFFATSMTASAASGDWKDNKTTVSVGNITINTPEELAGFAANVNAGSNYSGYTVNLGQNIDLSAHNWTAIGTNSHPFSGTFIGAGYTISGLSYTSTNMSNYGLFGYVSGATIKNVLAGGSINITDTSGAVTAEFGIAILVGDMENSSVIDNCTSSGSIYIYYKSTNSNYIYPNVGGIVGTAVNSAVKNSQNTAIINVTQDYSGSGAWYGIQIRVGGIAGRDNHSNIINSYNTGNISGTCTNKSTGSGGSAEADVGGIAGFFDSSSPLVSNCYNVGIVTANTSGSAAGKTQYPNGGGIIGLNHQSSTAAQYCYWLSTTAGHAYGASSSAVANTCSFTGTGSLSSTINNTTDLLTALNKWVSSNTGSGAFPWTQGSSYPTLVNNNSFTVSGAVSGLINNGGIMVSYTGSISGSVTTDGSGNYTINNIPYGGNITISVGDLQSYNTPAEINLTNITANVTGQNLSYTKNYKVTLSFVSASAVKDNAGTGTLRFITQIGLSGDVPTVTGFGTYIVPLSLFTEGEYSNTANVYYDNSSDTYAGSIKDGVTYSADLTNIPSSYSGTSIIAVSYVNLSNGDTVITLLNSSSVDESIK